MWQVVGIEAVEVVSSQEEGTNQELVEELSSLLGKIQLSLDHNVSNRMPAA